MLKNFVVVLVAIGLLGLPLLAADYAVGTWKLNVAKSKYTKGFEATDTTLVIAVANDTTSVSVKGNGGFVGAGKPWSAEYTVPAAGGPVTFTDGTPPAGMISELKIIDDRTRDFSTTINGKQVFLQHCVISANHKKMTATTTGINEQGQQFKNVEILDRQ